MTTESSPTETETLDYLVSGYEFGLPDIDPCMFVDHTAYVNGQRQGVVLEKPFRLGDTIGKESSGSSDSSSDQHKKAVLDIEAEIKLAFDSRRHSDDSASFSQEMKDLGLER